MAIDIDDILSEYDDLTDDVSRAKHTIFADPLKRWLLFIDERSEFSSVISRLEELVDYEDWKERSLIIQRGAGHGKIVFPHDTDQRISIQLKLFRELSSDDNMPWKFSHSYV